MGKVHAGLAVPNFLPLAECTDVTQPSLNSDAQGVISKGRQCKKLWHGTLKSVKEQELTPYCFLIKLT